MPDNLQPKRGLNKYDILILSALFVLVSILYLPQFWSGLSSMEPPEKLDVTTQWLHGYTTVKMSYQEGTFPLWNPSRYGGMPWLAYSHSGGLYPLNILVFTAYDLLDSVSLLHFIHCLIAAFGAYILFRDLKISAPAAFIGALVFSTGGYYFYMQSQLSNHATISWAPLFLFVLRRMHLGPGLLPVIGLALITAMMISGGDTEGFVYHCIFVFLFIVFFLRRESGGKTLTTLFLTGSALAIGVLICAGLVLPLAELTAHSVRSSSSTLQLEFSGIFENLHQYLPFIFFPWKYFRGMHQVADFNQGLAPFYIGALPLLLGLYSLGMYARDSRISSLWNIVFVMVAFLIVKKIDFFDPVLLHVPIVGALGTPERSLELVELAFLAAAGYGFDSLLFDKVSRGKLAALASVLLGWGAATMFLSPLLIAADSRHQFGTMMVLSGLVCFLMAGVGVTRLRPVRWLAVMLVLFDIYLLALFTVPRTSPGLHDLDPAVDKFIRQSDTNKRFISFEKLGPEVNDGELSGLISARVKFDSPWGRMRLPLYKYFEFLHLINPEVAKDVNKIFHKSSGEKRFFTFDLSSPAFLSDKNLHLLNLLGVKYVFSRGISFKFSSPFSLMNEEGLINGDWLAWPRERGLEAGFYREEGRHALEVELPYRVQFDSYVYPGTELAFELKPPDDRPLPWRVRVALFASEVDSSDMRLVHARSVEVVSDFGHEVPFLISLDEHSGKNIRFRLEIQSLDPGAAAILIDARLLKKNAPFKRVSPGEVDIFINTNALDRAFIVHEAASMGLEKMRTVLTDPSRFDPGRMVLFEEGEVPESMISLVNLSPKPVGKMEFARIDGHSFQKVKIKARLFSPGWLFLSDVDFPGWRVWVDGIESKIYRADYIFRAVLLSDGDHSIEFLYQPLSFRIGLWLCLSTLACAGILGLVHTFRPGKSKPIEV